jgi:hypothetical protein
MLSGFVVLTIIRHEILRMRVYRISSMDHLLAGGLYVQCLQTTDWSENTETPLSDFRMQFEADTCKVYTRSSQTQQSSEIRNLQ